MSDKPTGTLDVKVFGINEAQPISGARLTIKEMVKDATGKDIPGRILSMISTDNNGNAPSVKLPASSPHSELPYKPYMISVESPNFRTKILKGVQVFNKERALQHIQINPLIKPESEIMPHLYAISPLPGPEVKTISPHLLVGDYPVGVEEQRLEEITEDTIVEDPEVVLPPEITVHMGHPDKQARNVKVPILEYLRKVACGEIDPKAHVEAKRANIVALVSFTLNRLYTERYKGLGKDFDISSVTNPDHLFDLDQTMQASTVDIVDEMVGQFISTRNQSHPILTQYYNQERVGRYIPDWLEQTEADKMAKTGKKQMEIIRHFYEHKYGPLDARMAKQALLDSFPGHDLKQGVKSSAVKMLQKRINSISNSYPAISKVAIDGVFGKHTENAIIVFQRQVLGIRPKDFVDRRLWYRIGHYYWATLKIYRFSLRNKAYPTGYWIPVMMPMWVWKHI